MWYPIEPRMRNYVNKYGFLSYGSNLFDRYGKILTDTATKTGLDATNNALLIKQMEQHENW